MTSLATLLAVAAIFIGCSSSSYADVSFPTDGVLVYSSLCSDGEDEGGSKVVLIRGPEGVTAVYWRAEGAILAPLLAFTTDNVKLDPRTGAISLRFVDPELGAAGTYTLDGTITDDALTVKSNIEGTLRIPRARAAEGRLPKCQ
jgi:hypothetical protein